MSKSDLMTQFFVLQTSNTSTTAIYYLATNPDKQERLRQEIDRELETKDTRLTAQKLQNMRYLRACIKESMRYVQEVSSPTTNAASLSPSPLPHPHAYI